MSNVPADFLQVMNEGLDKYKQFPKCGLSLEVNDLPNNDYGNLVKNGYEVKYWQKPLDEKYFDADTDTTFALYRENITDYTILGMRTNRPYTAKHISWYYEKWEDLPEDEKNYFISASEKSSSGRSRLMELLANSQNENQK